MAIDFTPTNNVGFTAAPPKPKSLADTLWSGLGTVGNAVLGGASDLGTHLGQAAAIGTGKAATAITGNPALENKVNTKLAAGQNNIFGKPVKSLEGGITGVKQLAGDALKTGGELAALTTAPASLPAAIGVGAGVGASQAGGTALQNDASVSDIAKQTAIGGAVGGATGGAVYGLGKLIGAIGDKIQTSIIKPSKADIADGFSLDTIKKYGLGGPLNKTLNKTQAKLGELSTQLGEKLKASDATINMNDVYAQTVKELTDSSKLKGFGANAQILSNLDKLKGEIATVGDALSIPDAQVVKQASGSFGAWQYGKVDPDSKASEIVFNTFYNKLKVAIEKNSPAGVKGINQELSKLIPIQNAILRRLPVAQRSNIISLNEMIGLVGSAVNPVALGPTLLALLSKSGTAANVMTKVAPAIAGAAAPASLVSGQLPELVSGTGQ